jgi:hypothetical protein
VTPLAVGGTPAGRPVAYVRQKKLAIREDIRFYADEQETRELFRIKARSGVSAGYVRVLWELWAEWLTDDKRADGVAGPS